MSQDNLHIVHLFKYYTTIFRECDHLIKSNTLKEIKPVEPVFSVEVFSQSDISQLNFSNHLSKITVTDQRDKKNFNNIFFYGFLCLAHFKIWIIFIRTNTLMSLISHFVNFIKCTADGDQKKDNKYEAGTFKKAQIFGHIQSEIIL